LAERLYFFSLLIDACTHCWVVTDSFFSITTPIYTTLVSLGAHTHTIKSYGCGAPHKNFQVLTPPIFKQANNHPHCWKELVQRAETHAEQDGTAGHCSGVTRLFTRPTNSTTGDSSRDLVRGESVSRRASRRQRQAVNPGWRGWVYETNYLGTLWCIQTMDKIMSSLLCCFGQLFNNCFLGFSFGCNDILSSPAESPNASDPTPVR
jgi:hypothetical protein